MRVVLDTNVLISELIIESSDPAHILETWLEGGFTLLSTEEQVEEFKRVTRYAKIRSRLTPSLAGRLINNLSILCVMVDRLPRLDISPDPHDDYLLALAEKGQADYLVTGDKADLLALRRHAGTTILTVRDFIKKIS